MMTFGQKVVALGVILAMDLAILLFQPILGILALFASLPLAFVILRR